MFLIRMREICPRHRRRIRSAQPAVVGYRRDRILPAAAQGVPGAEADFRQRLDELVERLQLGRFAEPSGAQA